MPVSDEPMLEPGVHARVCGYVHAYVCVCMPVYVCVCVCACLCVRVSVCVYHQRGYGKKSVDQT